MISKSSEQNKILDDRFIRWVLVEPSIGKQACFMLSTLVGSPLREGS